MVMLNIYIFLVFAARILAWNHVTEAELRKAASSDGDTLVAFILPDESKSTALEPVWLSLQTTKPAGTDVLSFDCDVDVDVCKSYDIRSIPTIRLFSVRPQVEERSNIHGGMSYRGPRDEPSIRSFVRRLERPPLSMVDEHNKTAFASIDDVVFLASVPADDQIALARVQILAERYADRYSFAATLTEGPDAEFTIICYNHPDNMEYQLTQAELEKPPSLEDLVKKCGTPLIPLLTRRNEYYYTMGEKSLVRFLSPSHEKREEFAAEMRPLAKKYHEYLQFLLVDTGSDPGVVEKNGFPAEATEVFSVQTGNGDLYPYKGEGKITQAVIDEFLDDIIEAKVKPWVWNEEENEPSPGREDKGEENEPSPGREDRGEENEPSPGGENKDKHQKDHEDKKVQDHTEEHHDEL